MKRSTVLLAAAMLHMQALTPAFSATLNCSFTPVAVRIGIVGDPGFYTYACSASQCFNLGVYNTEKTKQFYAMALAAVSGEKQLTAILYNSSAADCANVTRTEEVFMMSVS